MAHAEAARFLAPARSRSRWQMRMAYLQDALLVCITALFVYNHGSHAIAAKSATSILFALDQAILVTLFLTRRRTDTTSTRVSDWVVAAIGGWITLAIRPHETGGVAAEIGTGVQVLGLTLLIVALSSLGRSFGVVAANRGLKTGGAYRLVRHPIYLAHAIIAAGFIMGNLWWVNIVIYATAIAFQVLRIRAEERVLGESSDYSSYKERVRWRLVPGLY